MTDQTTETARYRKKPIEIDTVQWTGDNEAEVQEFAGGARYFLADVKANPASDEPQATDVVYDRLHATWINVYTGQHIVRGVQGELYPIAEDVLAETYERVDDVRTASGPAEAPLIQESNAVTALYEQWVKAGPPPLGVSLARWWDARLAELHNAIRPPAA